MPDLASKTLALVGSLYDAAADPDSWPVFLDALGGCMRGIAPAVILTDRATDATRFTAVAGADPAWTQAYEAYYRFRDLRRPRIAALPQGATFIGSALLPDRDLLASEFYNDFLRPQGFFHILGGVPVRDAEETWVVRVIRERTAPAFDRHDLGRLHRLMPHLSRALRLHHQLTLAAARRDEAVEVLEWFPAGVLLLDSGGRLVAANRQGEDLLAAGDAVRVGRDGLRAALPVETAALRQAVAQAASGGSEGGAVLNLSRPSRRPLNLLVAPLRAGPLREAAARAAVVVFVTDPERTPAAPAGRVQAWLGLTRAEAALVRELLHGRSLEEAADALGVSPHTARTQLKRALAKTGTGRQAELVRLALSTPAILSR